MGPDSTPFNPFNVLTTEETLELVYGLLWHEHKAGQSSPASSHARGIMEHELPLQHQIRGIKASRIYIREVNGETKSGLELQRLLHVVKVPESGEVP